MYGNIPKRWKGFPLLYLLKLFLREQMVSPRRFEQHNTTINFFFFAYNDPLFIGGWLDISQLVSNVNGEAFGGTSHPFSDPKERILG
jgi:hypothetical protein